MQKDTRSLTFRLRHGLPRYPHCEVETMFRPIALSLVLVAAVPREGGATGQQFPVDDPIVKAIWKEGMERSQVASLAQVLTDVIGPRLPGSPAFDAGRDWVLTKFQEWGVEGRTQPYGTWLGWRRGTTHVDLVEPRVRSLNGTMLAWSPGTKGAVTARAVAVPNFTSGADLEGFLSTVRGAFVLLGPAEPTCRPTADWEQWATPAALEKMRNLQQDLRTTWRRSLEAAGVNEASLIERLEGAGALGVFSSRWTGNWGGYTVTAARNKQIPNIVLACEDYGLVHRLAANHQKPVLRVQAESEQLGTVPTYNILGEIRGRERPQEFVILSAHFDSWDGGAAATDNTSGTVTMMEAVRILKKVYPDPKRTILVALWNGEEQGLNGSRAFVADNPQIVENIQAVFNQDNGTGRITSISMQGFTGVAPFVARWLTVVPTEISQQIDLVIPGTPGTGGSDYASFVCAGVPAFSLSSLSWSYRQTYHNETDTFDKLVLDDLASNATLTAMLAYLASEEAERLPRDRRVLGVNPQTGEPRPWPRCQEPARDASRYFGR